jgi:type II secretory pathway pseudopilin PulG
VELLVVVVVLLILIVMTVTAIDFAFTSERVRAGARQIQSALEGARDRAIFAKEPRGLRFLVEQPDPLDSSDVRGRIVTSMIYIGAPSNWSEGQIRLERLDAVNNMSGASGSDGQADVIDTDGNGTPDGTMVKIVRGNDQCGWYTLYQRGFLGLFEDRNLNGVLDTGEDVNGNGFLDLDAPRIKIPADDNGSWYTVFVHTQPGDPYQMRADNQVLELITPYRDPGTTPPNDVLAYQGVGPNTYILELPPRVLPEAQPILLPDTVCIDLDGSVVPASWRPGDGAGLAVPYSSHMDILFSPRGVVTGPAAAFGLMHLYVAERKDVEALTTTVGVAPSGMRPPINSDPTSLARVPGQIVPGENQFTPERPVGHRALVSIFTQTGKVSSHPLDATDGDNDGYADNPFRYATQGKGTGQ